MSKKEKETIITEAFTEASVAEADVESVATPVEKPADEEFKRLPPYAINYNRLVALFGGDPELTFDLDEDTRTATISSKNYHKLEALGKVLRNPMEQLNIKLVNEGFDNEYVRVLEDAFAGNPNLDNIRIAIEAMTQTEVPVVTFKDSTIQFQADNRFVPHGYETTLAEILVKQLFNREYRRNPYVTKEKGEEDPRVIKSVSINGGTYPITWCASTDN